MRKANILNQQNLYSVLCQEPPITFYQANGLHDQRSLTMRPSFFDNIKLTSVSCCPKALIFMLQILVAGSALHYASQFGDVLTIFLLLCQGLNIKKKTHDGTTALMIATKEGNEAASSVDIHLRVHLKVRSLPSFFPPSIVFL